MGLIRWQFNHTKTPKDRSEASKQSDRTQDLLQKRSLLAEHKSCLNKNTHTWELITIQPEMLMITRKKPNNNNNNLVPANWNCAVCGGGWVSKHCLRASSYIKNKCFLGGFSWDLKNVTGDCNKQEIANWPLIPLQMHLQSILLGILGRLLAA